jgi:alcohol dehydrogenase
MKALLFEQPRQFGWAELSEPARPAPGEALVRVHTVGICGSDISGFLGKMPFFSYPRIPGHELGVEVLAVGEGVTHIQPGDRCSVEPYINCQNCFSCKKGNGNCCENLKVLGVHTDGGMRPRFIVPARKLHPGNKLSNEQLALVETLAIGCHAVDRGAPKEGENCLVVGAGPIGLSVLEFLRLHKVNILVADTNQIRLDFVGKQFGIKHLIQIRGGDTDLEAIQAACGGGLPTLVHDATGNPKAMTRSFDFVGFTGRMVFVGIVPDAVSFADPLFHRREMSLFATRNAHSGDFPRIIKLIEDGVIDTRPWITHRTTLLELPNSFETLIKPETGVVKAMVAVDNE